MSVASQTIGVELGDRRYDVVVGAGILAMLAPELVRRAGRLADVAAPSPGCAIVVDSNAMSHMAELAGALGGAGIRACTIPISLNEEGKSLASAEHVLSCMFDAGLDRGSVVIAMGGGLVGDLAGLCAGLYRRGIPWIQCPTTLLAMVDASTGGKTGVNLRAGDVLRKNMVGLFHQPAGVLADVRTLSTLHARQLRAGLAECLKHAIIRASEGRPGLTRRELPNVLARDEGALVRLIAANVGVKASIVSGDERETAPSDGRALLNLGHTFGHALETWDGVEIAGESGPITHGEAVALGIRAATRASLALGMCDEPFAAGVDGLLEQAGLPLRAKGVPDDATFLSLMSGDKKSVGGRLRLVLPDGRGARTVTDPPVQGVVAGIRAIRA